jgi:hypothetical protein
MSLAPQPERVWIFWRASADLEEIASEIDAPQVDAPEIALEIALEMPPTDATRPA